MNSTFVEFIVNLAQVRPETTVADVLERIMLERHCIEIEGQDAFSPDELSAIERDWRILIRCYRWAPDKRLEAALRDARQPIPWRRLIE